MFASLTMASPSCWRWCPSKTQLSPGEPFDFSHSYLDQAGLHLLWLLTQMANEFSMVMAPVKPAILCAFPGHSAWDRDRPGWLPPPPANWCFRSRLPFVVFGVSFKPWTAVGHMMMLRDPLAGRKEPRDVKPVASACLDRYQTPISSMITNLEQQKNRGRH